MIPIGAFHFCAAIVLLSPLLLLVLTSAIALWFPNPTRIQGLVLTSKSNREREISAATFAAIAFGLLASGGIGLMMLVNGTNSLVLDLGDWIAIHEESFHFHTTFIFDRLSIPFTILIYLLCGTVGAFTTKYLHREPGFQRFFILYSLFTFGMVISALAGTIEVLFFGWELVGLSSALLVGFFHERQSPVANGLRVWTIYRIADAAFLMAAVLLHHLSGEGNLQRMMGEAAWPNAQSIVGAKEAFGVGMLLLIAAAGKSALIPFSGWLPRAMEGPTASSAIFYGALSVHLGAYLLLRVSPLIAASPVLAWFVVALGLLTAIYASIVERVQSDIKSALAFASLTQVGLIVAEIGMGWYYLALFHLLGHACLRTLQLLRAPSLLRDYFKLETALGHRIAVADRPTILNRFPRLQYRAYRFAFERGYLDSMLDHFAELVLGTLRFCMRCESAWIGWWHSTFSLHANRPGLVRTFDGVPDSRDESGILDVELNEEVSDA
jgi:NAD(P)H-quinone oxidoreductase subunit 5